MKYFVELTLIDSNELSLYNLWSKVYSQLHLVFVEAKDHDDRINIGVSFSEYKFDLKEGIGFLGSKLRLFANTKKELQQLSIGSWLENLMDYIHITSICEVPVDKVTGYATYIRKQFKTNPERLACRRIKAGDINFDEALKRYQNVVTVTKLPFVKLKSLTNKHEFRLFIDKKVKTTAETGFFNSYGLSLGGTVPEF